MVLTAFQQHLHFNTVYNAAIQSPRVPCVHSIVCRRPFTGTFQKVTVERPSALGNLYAHFVWIALLGGTVGKFSRLITWPGASAFSGVIMLGAAGMLAIAIALSATSTLTVTIALSATGALAVSGTLDPLGAFAFIGTCAQDVLVGLQGGLWTLQGLIGVPRFAHTSLAPQVANAGTGATGYPNQRKPLLPRQQWGQCPSLHLVGGGGSGLMIQASPQLGGGMSGLSTPRASPLPSAGRGTAAYFAGPVMGPAPPRVLLPELHRVGTMCFHQARIWGRPA